MSDIIPIENITDMIHHIRGQKVMLDRDLAELYGVETRMLKQAVRRNIDRFPDDFMFELSKQELDNWRSQFVISNVDKMGLRHPPMAFTEQGVAMLSSVLRSKRAIQINIQIMRAFTRIKQIILDNADLRREIEELREETDGKFRIVFQTLEQLLAEEAQPKKKIGFTAKEKLSQFGEGGK
ncbi:ORF6N domain-containing protein [Desulfonatronovibrio magnus]|uniref:ORF6N domain-containing protein n=1 Tax=Desulfonatronovibrio magnus TaxID=698827 RepID=UPI0005EAEA38|nr:ORF6N domain-containing protein [Desulfonatronovibrio magnus]